MRQGDEPLNFRASKCVIVLFIMQAKCRTYYEYVKFAYTKGCEIVRILMICFSKEKSQSDECRIKRSGEKNMLHYDLCVGMFVMLRNFLIMM